MKLLHLDSSILADNSVTRELSAVVANTLRQRHANVETSYRDLAANPIAHLSGEIVGARFAPESDWTATQRSEAALSDQLIEEFLAADVLVIGAPMYNFSIPTQLRSWIDRVFAAGRTFKYTETGPVGLVKDKKVVLVSARGGVHSGEQGSLMVFPGRLSGRKCVGFLGVSDVEIIRAEAVNMGPDKRATSIHMAKEAIAKLAL